MRRAFTKMQGLGNDFVVIDATQAAFKPTPEQLHWLSDRRYGVGCDQVLVVEPPSSDQQDFDYRIYNADGSEVGQCGNGARALARFIRDQGLSDQPQLRVATRTARMSLQLLEDGQVRVDMGVPQLTPSSLPFDAPARSDRYTLIVGDGAPLEVGAVSMGNPHVVMQSEDLDHAPVDALGAALQDHPAFPERVNVGFLQVLAEDRAKLRVYERGAGETLACGSGACAAMVVGRLWGLLGPQATLELRGGELRLEWAGEGQPVLMSGPAQTVYRGEFEWPQA